jgi:Zinc dependent phospholipase C
MGETAQCADFHNGSIVAKCYRGVIKIKGAAARLAMVLLMAPSGTFAYSVLTHEAIIDAAWNTDIKPRLLARFPNSSEEDLRKAHATAYGGCIIQDMGYYPFGSKLFSDLLHYVRSGDFVVALFEQAQTLEDLAFAYGALAHYAADINGHKLAVNRAVAMEYPKLQERYGDVVTYADKPSAHIKTEFGFDVLQVARGRYAPKAYHDFIGFEVNRDLLDRAFAAVYALHLKDVFSAQDLAFGTYRYAVRSLIPTATKVAWKLKEKEIVADQPGMTRRKFLYNLSRSAYNKEWDGGYRRPGILTRILAGVMRVLPNVGPFKALSFRPPTTETARLFEQSFNRTLEMYRGLIGKTDSRKLEITDLNLDTGGPVVYGQYTLADRAYAQLTQKLAGRDPAAVPDAIRQNILAFYEGATGVQTTMSDQKHADDWRKTQAALARLRSAR